MATNPVNKRLCEHIKILVNSKIGNKMVQFSLKSEVAPFLMMKINEFIPFSNAHKTTTKILEFIQIDSRILAFL